MIEVKDLRKTFRVARRDAGFAQAAKAACIPFIPFDLAKALLGAYVTLAIQKRLGGKVTA